MNTTIINSNIYGTLTVETLQEFEGNLNETLPADYRAFLLRHNGGKPQPACFMAPDDPLEGEDSPLSEREVICFLPLHHNAWSDKTMEESLALPIHAALRDFKREQPDSDLLPIARDWSGNYICIGTANENRGKVFFYHHEYEEFSPLAENFDSFLEDLRACG